MLRRADAPAPSGASVLFTQPILTVPGRVRVALVVPVARLSSVLADLTAEGAELEHVFDY